jgi:MFS family permease
MTEKYRISREGLFVILSASLFFAQLAIGRSAYTAIQGILMVMNENPMDFANIQIGAQVAGTIASLFLPPLMQKHSPKFLMLGTTLICCIGYLGMSYTEDNLVMLGIWVALVNSAVVVSTSVSLFLINQHFSNQNRSILMSLYNTFYNLSLGLGPIVVAVFGVQGHGLFYFMIGVLILCACPLCLFNSRAHFPPVTSVSLVQRHPLHSVFFLIHKPYVLLVVLVGCINFSLFSYLLMFWGESYHITLEKASLLPTVFAAGGAFLAIPVGYIADRSGITKVIVGSIMVMIIAFVALSLDHKMTSLDFTALFCVGGCIAAQFALTFAVIGNAYTGADLLTATTGYTVIRQLSSIFLIYGAGEILEHFQAWGLNYTIIGLNVLFLGTFLFLKFKSHIR